MADNGQRGHRVRFDWGLTGARAIAAGADVAVVVDVLSFSTTVSVALDAGIEVFPYRWADATAAGFARTHDATLAVGRSAAREPGGISLSPASVRATTHPPARLVLPSPNGSTIAHELARTGATVIAACLRNAATVACWLGDVHPHATIAVIAAGERWPDGTLRPAAEDAWGAGAVLHGRPGPRSPEADLAVAAYERIRGDESAALAASVSGRELIEQGFPGDVQIAAEVDTSPHVPILDGDRFRVAPRR